MAYFSLTVWKELLYYKEFYGSLKSPEWREMNPLTRSHINEFIVVSSCHSQVLRKLYIGFAV